MEKKNTQEKQVKVMEWPTPEDKNKSWGSSGYDRHFIGKGK